MKTLNISVESWIIQDGNYDDFVVGQNTNFALEFFPHSLNPSQCKSRALKNQHTSRYQICAQVEFCESDVWVLNMGVLSYQRSQPPDFVTAGSWVEGELSLGIDPFFYFEELKNRSGMPALTYSFFINKIFLETTPWLTKSDQWGRKIMQRAEQDEGYREIVKTDAWNDDNGNAHYVIECTEIDDRIEQALGADWPVSSLYP